MTRPVRAAVSLVLIATLVGIVNDLFEHHAEFEWLLIVAAVQCGVLAIAWSSMRVSRLARHRRAIAVWSTSALCVTTGLSGVFRGDPTETVILLMLICVVVGTLFPWGLRAQVIVVGVAVAVAVGAILIVDRGLTMMVQTSVIMSVGASIYAAHQLQRKRDEMREAMQAVLWRSAALGAVPNGVLIADQAGRIVWVNPAFSTLTGYASDEVIGRNPRLLSSGKQDQAFYAALWSTLAAGQVWQGELVNRRKDGVLYDEEMTITPWRDGAAGYFIAVKRDITERKHAEAVTHETEARFRTLVEHALDLVAIIDGAGVFQFASPSHMAVLGYTPEEMLGRSVAEFVHPDDLSVIATSLAVANANPGAERFAKFRMRHCDGSWRYIEAVGKALNGEATLGIVQSRDVTARVRAEKALSESEYKFRTLVSQIPAITYIAGTEPGRPAQFISPQVETILGVPPQTWLSDPNCFPEHIHPEDRQRVLGTFEIAHASGAPISLEYRMVDAAGEIKWVHDEARAITNEAGTTIAVLGVALDITDRKQTEEALRAAKHAAEAANRAKSEFLAQMSHEIRTPMNAIMGMTSLALETSLDSEQREYLELVQSSADALLQIINDILELSKIEARKLDLNPKPFHLRATLERITKTLEARAIEKDIKLRASIDAAVPDVVVGDAGRLRQILVNLIGNAIKFTPYGEVVVEVTVDARGDDGAPSPSPIALHFAVRDTGIGISMDQQEVIFEAFEQGEHGAGSRFGGTGLGLTISKRLTELMHGRMWVESAPGAGSTFHFTATVGLAGADAPIDFPLEVAAPPSRAQTAARRSFYILLAEDNLINQTLAVRVLQKRGHRVVVAGDGHAAIAALEREGFDAVLMDVEMPEMDGISATMEIRRREREHALAHPDAPAPHIPIIAMTAHAMQSDEVRCRDAGMDGFITKPMHPATVLEEIESVIGARAPAGPSVSLPEQIESRQAS